MQANQTCARHCSLQRRTAARDLKAIYPNFAHRRQEVGQHIGYAVHQIWSTFRPLRRPAQETTNVLALVDRLSELIPRLRFDAAQKVALGPLHHLEHVSAGLNRGSGTITGRVVLERKTVHIPDVLNDPEYEFIEGQKTGGYRAMLGVPLMRDGVAIGVLIVGRSEPRPFTAQQIELAETFADQAVIAIENVRLFDEIQDKSRQLEVASQHKSQFLANMSHELRTPLNAILGYTELMAVIYGELPEKTMGVLKRLESNGRHLLGLINDVLDLSKIEAGQLTLDLSDYSLEDIAQTVRSTLEPLAADKKLAFKVEVAPKMPPGYGDGRRLTQVLINLVGNAIKFTDTGEVVIKASATDGSFHLSVRDTGPGISAADQAKLFQEFQQADNATHRRDWPNHSRYARRQSLGRVAGRPGLDVFVYGSGSRCAAGGTDMSKRILVVEDHEDNRLSATDYEITEPESGEQALAVVAVQRPDPILISNYPARNGKRARYR